MQPSIPAGTVLQNRYRLLSVLGQGGFGRTYLAEDQGRFNERCALKEFIPLQMGAYALDKSKELFQREAAILYQIQHPQIPQFRATFEENQRLFLVQDYVEGKTYRALLNERKQQGLTFSEAEVLQLMRQMLPVLAHIHSKGIIHRDIAPDNMMLRQQDQLPVLIDFGVVKEIVTRVQSPETVPQHTTVGKLGYAPTEQMQTGRAYPNSDLYALAVTAVVLLTGQEPQELYDDLNLTWSWQRWANVSPGFAQILNRMLSPRPGDRYQSVSEVVQALQAMTNPAATPPTPTAPVAATPTPNPNLSQVQTVAVGRRPDPVPAHANPPRQLDPVISSPSEGSVWDNPWAVIGIGTGLAVVAGIGSWAVVSAVLNTSSPTPSSTPTPTPTVVITPTPKPTPPSTEPVEFNQRLNIGPGESTKVESTLKAKQTVTYIITAEQGETLSASLEGEGVLMTVLAPNRELVDNRAKRVPAWQGPLDFTGDYFIQLSPVRGVQESNYRLNVSLEAAPEPDTTPIPTPPSPSTPSPVEPEINTQRIEFPAGSEGVEVADRVDGNLIRRYLVNAQAGQILNVELTRGAATLDIRDPDGKLIEDASGVVFWQSQLPDNGDYQIDVIAAEAVDFTLKVGVRNGG